MAGKSGLALVQVAGSPLKMLWNAGIFGNYDAKFKKKFNRRKYINVSLIDSCELTCCKCCEGSINIYIASWLVLGLARIHHRQCSWLLEDAKDLTGAYEESKKAQSLTVGLSNLNPTSPRSIDVPRSRPGHVDLPSLDYSACSSLLQLNQSSIDMFKNAYIKDGDYLTFRANHMTISTGQDDSLYAEVGDAYTANPRDITLPEIPMDKSKDIMVPGLDDSFGDGGMGFFDPDAKFPYLASTNESLRPGGALGDNDQALLLMDDVSNSFQCPGGASDQSVNSIVPHDRQKGAAEYPLPLGGVSQFSLEDIFTAPSTSINRRRRVTFRKRVFDRGTCLPEYDPKPELLTKDYKTRPGPRARMPAPSLNKEHFSINNMSFLDQRFSKLLKGWDGDAAMSNPPPPTHVSPISPLSQSELEKSRIMSKDNLTQKSDQASRSRLTSSLKNSVSLQPGKSRIGGGVKSTTNPGGLSPIADVEAEEYTYSIDAGMMDDDTPEQPFVKELPEQATTPQPLNRSTVDQFAETVGGKLVQSRSLLFTDIAPPGIMDKRTAASKFFKLLSAASQPKHNLKLEQEKAYGRINISNGT